MGDGGSSTDQQQTGHVRSYATETRSELDASLFRAAARFDKATDPEAAADPVAAEEARRCMEDLMNEILQRKLQSMIGKPP